MPDQSVPDGSIVITPKEFYDGVRQDVSKINEGVASIRELMAPIPERLNTLEQTTKDHDSRLDTLERRGAWVAGFAAAAGGVVGAVLSRLVG